MSEMNRGTADEPQACSSQELLQTGFVTGLSVLYAHNKLSWQ